MVLNDEEGGLVDSSVRPVDLARASRLVMSSLTSDPLMFATTLEETIDDDWGIGELGSLINVLRTMADDLAGALVDVHGQEAAEDLVRMVLARFSRQEPPKAG